MAVATLFTCATPPRIVSSSLAVILKQSRSYSAFSRYWIFARHRRTTSPGTVSRTSLIGTTFPRDFDIFSVSSVSHPLCIQTRAKSPPEWARAITFSLSWCG